MAGNVLPDTNVVIPFFLGDPAVVQRFGEADEIFASSVVLGELFYGARNSTRSLDNLSRVEAFVGANKVLPCDADTARRYGVVKAALRAKGRMIPDNDLWIAATALQYQLELATRDAHFLEIEGLQVVAW